METQYKYIYFSRQDQPTDRKTARWECHNNHSDALLGWVAWYSPWRQYCFYPNRDTIFNSNCMLNIVDFIGQLMDEHKYQLSLERRQS